MKNKKVFFSVLTGACLAMAMTMPSCPGQQAMQQQIDTLQSNQQEIVTKVRGLETQVKGTASSSEDVKRAIGEISAAVTAQKAAIDNLNAAVQQLDAKIAAGSSSKGAKHAPAGKPVAKRRH